jgi:NADH:ubiquinone oxidoreductase subunit F (NADH-binding)/(2Fe-2S) ferredoxin/Pyruvate/2-oxoacid:ferredoxin oxidoreductase delta subunit
MRNDVTTVTSGPARLSEIRTRAVERIDSYSRVVRICNTGCRSRRSAAIVEALKESVLAAGLANRVLVRPTGCHGFCEMGPVMVVEPPGLFYVRVSLEDIPELVSETLIHGRPLNRLLWQDSDNGGKVLSEESVPFYAVQRKLVLGKCGKIDPTFIEDYIAEGGYRALTKAVPGMRPEEVLREIEASGLRGRGGGGFPAGRKWRSCREAEGPVKYVIANGDEGDPGAFMDRSLMEGDPHAIVEGMIIGAYAIGASLGYIYVRDEYPIAVDHLSMAIQQARQYGLLGENILGADFTFDISISRGAGAFVCGESTALMNSLQGQIGEPRSKYVHTVESGLWDKPSNLNNVETWATVPLIIDEGAEWFAGIGNESSKGTKIFSLAGRVKNTGLVEVPLGTTLRKIIYDIGGGIQDGRSFKAVQTGGPSGGCLPASRLDMVVDYDRLVEAGSMMGSGGMIVMDDSTCMVDVAKYFVGFLLYESCGKCVPCREGLVQMNDLLNSVATGEATGSDLEALTDLAAFMKKSSLCGLGQSAANPVLSTLRYFRDEYEAHVFDKKCPAGVCRALIRYVVDPDLCNGCSLCRKECPEQAVMGERKAPHVIDQERCIRCGLCLSLCKPKAIRVE